MIFILGGTGAEVEAYAKDNKLDLEHRQFVNGANFFRERRCKSGDKIVLTGTWEARTDLPTLRLQALDAGFDWPDPQNPESPPKPPAKAQLLPKPKP